MTPPEIKDKNNPTQQFERFYQIVQALRKLCPWDAKQTNESIAQLMIEEVYECIDDIYNKNDAGFSKELGDLLLHIVLHSIIAEERGAFDMAKVIDNECNKMIHRHPHVFSDVKVKDENEVLDNWEALKMKEGTKSILEGVPKSMPQLLRAERIQHKVSRVGFDWDNKEDVWAKVFEEIEEFKAELENKDKENARKEFGDILFALVNAGRHEDLIAEEALQLTNNKFTKRFQFIEKEVHAQGKKFDDISLEEMDAIWDKAKEAGL